MQSNQTYPGAGPDSFKQAHEYRVLRAGLGAKAFPPSKPHNLENTRGPGYSNTLLHNFLLHGAMLRR
jgi:hypothetical protein